MGTELQPRRSKKGLYYNFFLQDYKTVRSVIVWLDPAMENYTIDAEKEYGADCWDITWERIWSHFDWFAFGHYFGWGMKVQQKRDESKKSIVAHQSY